ncbi:NAD-dependent epimerase/dehydratase family protein [Rubrivivax sp. JA1024]|nr:NAD-dependent epimerase/dehydratase family protein [Rubrivivax sp. JA1024]
MTTLVVGASGFVGRHLLRRLSDDRRDLRVAVHHNTAGITAGIDVVRGSLEPGFDWRPVLTGCDAVVHLAARVHVMSDDSRAPLAEYRRANVDGTLSLARQAAEVGVRRFVFLSSVKACGEATPSGRPLTEDDSPAPQDPYGVSKSEAEAGLRSLAQAGGIEVAILRPPLVYGPGVRANFLSMMRWLQRGVPLPLASIDNRRSLVGSDNLVDLIAVCLDHPAAAGETFFASDGDDLSTPDLLRRLAAALGTRARLLPAPAALLIAAATVLGQSAAAQRLCSSLQVDIGKARRLLGWTPPHSVDDQLARTARWYLDRSPET